MNNNITPSKYAKKVFVIFEIIIFALVIGSLIVNVINYDKIGCHFFSSFVLGIIFIPALFTLTYNAFLGTKRILKNPAIGRGSYYWVAIPLSLLSIAISVSIWLITYIIPYWLGIKKSLGGIRPCSTLFIFLGGGWIIFPIWFIFLCVISIIELYVIKKKVLSNKTQEREPNEI